MFHEIGHNPVDKRYTVTPELFEQFIANLIHYQKHPLFLNDILGYPIRKKLQNSFMITFDDAYAGVYLHAFPVLKKYKIPFTVFISVSLLNKPGYLTEKQLKVLSDNGLCTIGSHGLEHIYFRELTCLEVKKQFGNSKEILEVITGKEVYAFAFPYGTFYECSLKNIRALSTSVYKIGFSTIPTGFIHPWLTYRYFLPRINVTEKFIRAKLNYDQSKYNYPFFF